MFTTLEKVGIVCMSVVGFKIVRSLFPWIYNTFLGPHIGPKIKLKDMGNWALITGSTDGVGKAYAQALAKEGLDIVLVSRTLSKLETVAAEIEAEYKVQTKVIEADFTEGPDVYPSIEKHLYGLEIGVLVNNVGISYPHPEYFLDLPNKDKIYSDIIKCNIMSVTNMCKMVMPGMVERGRGVVINVSSTGALIPSPLLTVYGASKAYIEKFSSDLLSEYRKRGVIVQCISPGYVATKMSKIKSSTWMAPTPQKFVAHAMRTIGVQSQTTGYYPHAILVGIVRLLESICPALAVYIVLSTMKNIRARALRKYLSK